MKKIRIVSILLMLVLIPNILFGCSSEQKTEEELRAEIRAELEAEQQKVEELKAEIKAELESEQKENEGQEGVGLEAEKQESEQKVTTKEQTEDITPIALSAFMTMDQIKNKLGTSYTFETIEDGGYFLYYSILKYEGIEFTFYHDDKEVSADARPDYINIASNKYTYQYDFKIGDPASKAFEYCEKNFENVIDHHNDVELYNWFIYKEKNSKGEFEEPGLVIAWSYDNDEQYSNKSEIGEDVKINSIGIFVVLD